MENEKDNYWIGFACGSFCTFMLILTVGILDYRGFLDPILDSMGLPK